MATELQTTLKRSDRRRKTVAGRDRVVRNLFYGVTALSLFSMVGWRLLRPAPSLPGLEESAKARAGRSPVDGTAAAGAPAHARSLKITGVATNTDSVKVRFDPVPGAADYRIYESDNPTYVKYAGTVHLFAPSGFHFKTDGKGTPLVPSQVEANTPTVSGPTGIDVTAHEIELNGLSAHASHTLVVEAVDALGPVCQGSLYDKQSHAAYAKLCTICKLGGNMGDTSDGNMSTNGQGSRENHPHVIASATTKVEPTGIPALPSSRNASQVLFDTFDGGTITPVGPVDAKGGIERFTMKTPTANWEIRTENIDTLNSKVFIQGLHFMDIVFDGGTPGSNNPLHQGHGVVSISPTQSVDFQGGKILHITQEVDAVLASRRWVDVRLAPADAPYLAFETNGRINRTDTDLMIQIFGSDITIDERTGAARPNDANSPPIGTRVVGAAGQGKYTDGVRPGWTTEGKSVVNPVWQSRNQQPCGFQQGWGLDNRSRFDIFVSKTHFAVYEDGVKITEHDLLSPLPFEVAKVYFSHYHYHSALEVQELKQYTPWASYWLTTFPFSDERHWDNMGYEVLPAATNWSTLAGLVQPPAFR